MQSNNYSEKELSDTQIIQRLKDNADAENVFESIQEWSLEKVRRSLKSRGDYFDRKGILAFEQNGKEVLRVCMCSLPVTIGSSEQADYHLDYDGISRLHCRLEQVGNLVRLHDSRSKNGTWLNGKRITFEDLCEDDEIQIGMISLRVKRY